MKTRFFFVAFWIVAALRADNAAPLPTQNATLGTPLLTSSTVLSELAVKLSEHYRIEGELQLEFLRAWTMPAGASTAALVTVIDFPAALAPSMLLRVRLLDEAGRALADTTTHVRVQHFREVWSTRSPVERGAVFDAADLETRRVDVLREREALPVNEGERDFTYARAVPGGRTLTWRDVERRALVRKGQVIEVAAVDGMLSVTMKGLAMENGAAGEVIKVRNLESKKDFSALVVAESRAQVRF